MTSHEISQKLSQVLGVLSNDNEFIEFLSEIASAYDDLLPIITGLLAVDHSKKDLSNAINEFYRSIEPKRKEVAEVIGKLKSKRPAKTLIMLDKLVDDLDELSQSDRPKGLYIQTFSDIRKRLENFYKIYEASINNLTWDQAMKLLVAAKDLHHSILAFQDFVTFIKRDLERTIDVPPDNKVASFFFQFTTEYDDFLNKLLVLDRLYSELCILANVSKSEYPLRIIKLEAGSLYIKLFGKSKLIDLLTALIKSAANFFYRNFTNEGKITAIPRNIQAVEEVLSLAKKLEAEGIDVSVAKDNLQKATVIISAQLNKLLLREPSVEVDGEKYSVTEAMQDKYLTEGQRLLLEDGTRKE